MRLLAPLKRFDARNRARRSEELQALFDGTAHYRQTMALAEEQVEAVEKIVMPDERTGENVTRYLFEGEQFASLRDAEAARMSAIAGKAREFYIDLDRTYLSRRRPRTQAEMPHSDGLKPGR